MISPEKRKRCLPWRHKWVVTRVSVPMFDPWAKGELRRCERCRVVKAK